MIDKQKLYSHTPKILQIWFQTITTKQIFQYLSHMIFWFPGAYKSLYYTVVKYAIALCLKNMHTLI